MRLTVGPLPSSVYWRRRAGVLGAAIVMAMLVFYSCSGTTKSGAAGKPSDGPKATVTGIVATADLLSPSPSPATSPIPEVTAPPSATASADPVIGADPKLCTDAEIAVTARSSDATMRRDSTVVLYLFVKNVGNRTCTRDIGPDLQELWVVKGTERVWSSDDCDAPRGTNLKSFNQGLEMSFNVAWNGHYSTTCTKTAPKHANGEVAAAGNEYRVFARVGTKISAPLKLTIK